MTATDVAKAQAAMPKATASNGKIVMIDTTKLPDVIDKMRDVQTEGDRWELAETLFVMIPKGSNGFSQIIDAATKEGVVGNLSANTLRLYRDTANRWPEAKRVKNVSFSAHREAMVLPSVDAAVKMLNDLAKVDGPGKVTVASVRKAVAIKQGKQPKAKQGKTPQVQGINVLRDLEHNGGTELIGIIGSESDSDKLDKLHSGLNKVIAHVERLQAKAARKAKPAPKVSTPPASKPAVGKPSPKAKAAGDLRGL